MEELTKTQVAGGAVVVRRCEPDSVVGVLGSDRGGIAELTLESVLGVR
jgi:hypothetical protein